MKNIIALLTLAAGTLALLAVALDADPQEVAGNQPEGYVLKLGEGEVLNPDRIIKASPKSGTQGSVMVLDRAPADFTVGLHYHTEADEFFYILAGRGTFRLNGKGIAIGPGDIIFVPAGQDHGFSVSPEQPLEMLVFLDRPGLAQDFRELHALRAANPGPMTLDERNAIARKYGTIYKKLSGPRSFGPE